MRLECSQQETHSTYTGLNRPSICSRLKITIKRGIGISGADFSPDTLEPPSRCLPRAGKKVASDEMGKNGDGIMLCRPILVAGFEFIECVAEKIAKLISPRDLEDIDE